MTKSAAVPFTFDTSFDTSESATQKRAQKRTLTLDEIELIERKAFEAGVSSTRESQTVALTRGVERLIDSVGELGERVRTELGRAHAEAAALSYVIARKLAETSLSVYPQTDIEALIAKCFEDQKGEAAIVLRVNDTLIDTVKTAATRLKSVHGFDGRIAVIGEPQIPVGDCAIEWADGGLTRNLDRALHEVEAVVKGYMCAETGDQEPTLFTALTSELTSKSGERA